MISCCTQLRLALRAASAQCGCPRSARRLTASSRAYALVSQGVQEAQEQALQRAPRFYVEPAVLRTAAAGSVFQLDALETHHALRVLRLHEGDCLEVCDGRGNLVTAQLRGVTHKKRAYAEAVEGVRQVAWQGPRWEVVAACGAIKGGRADWLVEKCTELGAWSLCPLLTTRSPGIGRRSVSVRLGEPGDASEEDIEEEPERPAAGREARWARIAQSAVKQCLRAHALRISEPVAVARLAERMAAAPIALVAAAGGPPVRRVMEGFEASGALAAAGAPGAPPALLLVGPEGDFTPGELAALAAAGGTLVGLGERRLRVETAAMALLAAATLFSEEP